VGEEKKQIGRILLKQKRISLQDLEAALSAQAKATDGLPLASRLTATGVVSETDALRALSEQFGVPAIDLLQITLPLTALDIVPRELAETNRVLPVLVRDDRVFLAMANPLDTKLLDELAFRTGRRVYAYVAMTTTLEKTIQAAYQAKDRGERVFVGPNAPAPRRSRPPPPDDGPQTAAETTADQAAEESVGRSARSSVEPGSPGVLLDDSATERAAAATMEEQDFGALGDEVSEVIRLTDEQKAIADAAAASVASQPAKKTVLVVDDEDDIRSLVKRVLADKGYNIVEADRGRVALRMIKDHTPDLILLDAMLPELHGFDLARRIKGSERYGTIPIIMLSAVYRGPQIGEDLKSTYGIEAYLEKPFRIADLITKVEELLTKGGGERPRDLEAINRQAHELLDQGIAAYKKGEIDEAIAILKRGTEIDPLAYRLRYHLGLIYGKKGQTYDGIAELERAVDLNPRYFGGLKNLAVLYEKAGFRGKARDIWERCAQLSEDAKTREQIEAHLRSFD
jgi:DNA-binding response OmpR family regulator